MAETFFNAETIHAMRVKSFRDKISFRALSQMTGSCADFVMSALSDRDRIAGQAAWGVPDGCGVTRASSPARHVTATTNFAAEPNDAMVTAQRGEAADVGPCSGPVVVGRPTTPLLSLRDVALAPIL